MKKVSSDYPLISIIVPVYKVEKYLKKCVDSITNQTYKNLEIILVDDGSPDNCGKICDDYAKSDSRIVVFHKKNGGLSSARNYGIKHAKGDFISFVDSDDWINKDMYLSLYEDIKNNDADIACCDIIRVKNENDILKSAIKTTKIYEQSEYIKKYMKIGSQTCEYYAVNKLYKRNLLTEEQYPLDLTSEDVLGTYKAILKANKIVVSDLIGYYYRINNQSITGQFSSKDYDLITIWNMVLEYTKKNAPQYYDYALINRMRIDFTLLYRISINMNSKLLKKDKMVKKLLLDLKQNEKYLLKSNIAFSRKIIIFMFCRNYFFCAKILKFLH